MKPQERPIPEAVPTSVDFEEFDPGHQAEQYVVEWLRLDLPVAASSDKATQAA